ADDFVTFTLPAPAAWAKLKAGLGRAEQIAYLAARLRLLTCIQTGQPGGVSYGDTQYAASRFRPARGPARQEPVVNPFTELLAMKLTVGELPLLVPRLADESFMPTFSYWRDFHPQRTLHRVSWAAAEIINAVATRDLADLPAYQAADPAGRARHLERIVSWCRGNAGKTPAELARQALATATSLAEVQAASREAMRLKDAAALPVLIARMKAFPRQREELVRIAYAFDSAAVVPQAREWLKDPDEGVRFFAALVLLRHGRRAELEGLDALRPILARDDGSLRSVEAFDALMDTGQRPAIDLACQILAKPRFEIMGSGAAVHRLFLAGRREALDYVLGGLQRRGDGGTSSGQYRGRDVERKQVEGDAFAAMVTRWQTGNRNYDVLAPDGVRAAERGRLAAWLRRQFALIKAGKTPAMRTRAERLVRGEWQIDAP
ncbi:MAG TPA: HEAT repeat domain-containing protein, partial [Polyangia bacterium]